jgi:hypothetical protein
MTSEVISPDRRRYMGGRPPRFQAQAEVIERKILHASSKIV